MKFVIPLSTPAIGPTLVSNNPINIQDIKMNNKLYLTGGDDNVLIVNSP